MARELLSSRELEAAKAALDNLAKSDMRRPILLHNALRAFIRDIGRRVAATTSPILRFTDVSEIYAWVAPDDNNFNAVTFGGLLLATEAIPTEHTVRQERLLRNLDRLALQRLLFDETTQVGMVDSHVFEYRGVRDTLRSKVTNLHSDLITGALPLLETVNRNQFARLRSFLESTLDRADGRDSSQFHREFEDFRRTFIPDLSDQLIGRYRIETAAAERLNEFERVSRRGRLIQIGYGLNPTLIAAFEKWGAKIDVSALSSFLDSDATRDDFVVVRQAVVDLATQIQIARLTPEARRAAMLTDAHAIAVLHTFNTFLQTLSYNFRFELISRSHTLESVIAVLPPDRINVTIRHPLFLPEIYQFSESALAELATLAVNVEGLVRPWIDTTELDDNGDSANALSAVRGLGRDIVRLLAEAATIQVAASHSGQETLIIANPATTKRNVPTSKDLLDLLELLSRAMDERKSPLSEQLIRELGRRTIQLVVSEHRLLESAKPRMAIVNFVSAGGPGTHFPHSLARFRFTDGKLSRTFFLYGDKLEIEALLGCKIPPLDSAKIPSSIQLKTADLIEIWLVAQEKDVHAILTRVQLTLLCALSLAVEGRYTAAAAVASPILSTITRKLHRFDDGKGSDRDLFKDPNDSSQSVTDPRVALAYKELFLLRHYCERASGAIDFNSPGKDPFDVNGVRSFARAQRDLDFAILMAEQAHRLAKPEAVASVIQQRGDIADTIPWAFASAGVQAYEDFRFPLINFAGWLDQFVFLMLRADDGTKYPTKEFANELRKRHDLWVSAAFIKDVEVRAFRLARLGQLAGAAGDDDGAKERFFAYHEARALSGLYLALIVFLSFDVSPEVQALWNPFVDLGPDRLLVFRNHVNWIDRLRALQKNYRFTLRPLSAFDQVADYIGEINELRGQFKRLRSGKDEKRKALVQEYEGILDRMAAANIGLRRSSAGDEVTDFSGDTLLSAIFSKLKERGAWLRTRTRLPQR
jgi:hypothetical protein